MFVSCNTFLAFVGQINVRQDSVALGLAAFVKLGTLLMQTEFATYALETVQAALLSMEMPAQAAEKTSRWLRTQLFAPASHLIP